MGMRGLCTLLVYCCIVVSYVSEAYSTTRGDATEVALRDALGGSIAGSNVYIAKKLFPPNATIRCLDRIYTAPAGGSWLFFSDDHPEANWMHPARIVFVDSATGAFSVIPESCPPQAGSPGFVLTYDAVVINVAVPPDRYGLTSTPLTGAISGSSNDRPMLPPESKYAVLISGGTDSTINFERYYYDLKETYTVLKNDYGYSDTNIYVLCADGDADGDDSIAFDRKDRSMDLDGDGGTDLFGAATVANVVRVFAVLSARMTRKDMLYVFTTDHGDNIHVADPVFDEGFLSLWGERMRDDQFAAAVNQIVGYAFQVFTFVNCFSGDMINDLRGRNRVIAAAARWDELSWGRAFCSLWLRAVNGSDMTADANHDWRVSMHEAFLYAKANDPKPEHPQYYESAPGLGARLTLSGPMETIPVVKTWINTAYSDQVTNYPRIDFKLRNEEPERTVSLGDIEIRYWYAASPSAQQAACVDYAELRQPYRNAIGGVAIEIVPRSQGTQTHYLCCTFTDTTLGIAPGEENAAIIQTRFHSTDWSLHDQRDDWSYIGTADFTDAPNVTVYYQGILVWGTEPPAEVVPPPVSLKASYCTYAPDPESNTIYINIRILNTGAAAVDLSSVSANYWFAKEGNCPEQVHLDWAGKLPSGQAMTSSTAGTVEPAGTGGQTSAFRLSFAGAAGSLEPQNHAEVHVRVNKSDWSKYTQTNDYSFGPYCTFVDWSKVVLYVNNMRVWGTEP